jgi:hypothetical protein
MSDPSPVCVFGRGLSAHANDLWKGEVVGVHVAVEEGGSWGAGEWNMAGDEGLGLWKTLALDLSPTGRIRSLASVQFAPWRLMLACPGFPV